jgi:hypothetical protein
MDVERIRELRLADPFMPFALILDDGRRLLVKEPYFLAIGQDGRRVSVATGGESFEFFTPERVRDVELSSPNDR